MRKHTPNTRIAAQSGEAKATETEALRIETQGTPMDYVVIVLAVCRLLQLKLPKDTQRSVAVVARLA